MRLRAAQSTSFGVFLEFWDARGFNFPSQWFLKCPEVFWFHPAEFALMDNLILFLLPNIFFPSFTFVSSCV
jgi:hypothetical protein